MEYVTGAAVSSRVLLFFFFFFLKESPELTQLRHIPAGGVSMPENSNHFICYVLDEFRFYMTKLLFPALSIPASAFYIFG